jgi:hypothetical protein
LLRAVYRQFKTITIDKSNKKYGMKSNFSPNTETILTAVFPLVSRSQNIYQHRKPSFHGPMVRKHTEMGTILFSPRKLGPGREGGVLGKLKAE